VINDPRSKLFRDIEKFLDVYKILSAEAKAQFEAQLAGAIKDKDQNTKNLYLALLAGAKAGINVDEVIQQMNQANKT
jgi:hypothetical protein